MTDQEKKRKAHIAAKIRQCERQITRQEKIYKEAYDTLPMSLDEKFCRRIMDESQKKQADLRKQIDELKRSEVENGNERN